jgi:hypothetical protein
MLMGRQRKALIPVVSLPSRFAMTGIRPFRIIISDAIAS